MIYRGKYDKLASMRRPPTSTDRTPRLYSRAIKEAELNFKEGPPPLLPSPPSEFLFRSLCPSPFLSVGKDLFTAINYFLSLVVLCVHAQSCWILCDPMGCAHQAPLSMGFSRQEHWSGQPLSTPGLLPDSGIQWAFPASAASALSLHPLGSP